MRSFEKDHLDLLKSALGFSVVRVNFECFEVVVLRQLEVGVVASQLKQSTQFIECVCILRVKLQRGFEVLMGQFVGHGVVVGSSDVKVALGGIHI